MVIEFREPESFSTSQLLALPHSLGPMNRLERTLRKPKLKLRSKLTKLRLTRPKKSSLFLLTPLSQSHRRSRSRKRR